MPRMPYADPAQVPPRVRETMGEVPLNVARMLAAASESVFHGFNTMAASFYGPSKLDPQLRELAIIRVGSAQGSRYQAFHHESFAKLLGATDAQIAAAVKGGQHPGVLTAIQQATLDFTDDIIQNVRAGDATLLPLQKLMSQTEIFDLIMVTGFYMMIARLLETAEVPVEATPLDWSKTPTFEQQREISRARGSLA